MKRSRHRVLWALILICAVFVCRGGLTTLNPPHRQITSTIPAPLDEAGVLDLVFNLKEVREFDARIKHSTAGRVRAELLIEHAPEPAGRYWQVYVGENHDDHTAVWNRFRVNADDRQISILTDAAEETCVSLDQWRSGQRTSD